MNPQMDYSKLKGRPSFPFETIGVAVAFSPRLEGLIGEAKRIADACEANLILFHIGERTRSKESKLDEVFRKLGIDEKKIRVIWNPGNAVDTLLELCKLNIVDLLIVGALQRENMLQFYLGTIARRISRKAKCSVLLLTSPDKKGSRFRRIIVNGTENPKTPHTLRTAFYFAERTGGKEICVAKEVNQTGLESFIGNENTVTEAAKLKKEFSDVETGSLHQIVEELRADGKVGIIEKPVKGKPGFAVRQYAEQKKADLLVVNSPDVKLGIIDRIFTHDMEYILEKLPCNVLIVHSRISH